MKSARSWLFVSVTLNIFLVAFVAGGPLHMLLNGMLPPPPPFIQASYLFSRKDADAHVKQMQEASRVINAQRKAFGEVLQSRPVSEAEVHAQFQKLDGILDALKHDIQKSAAMAISSMSDEERVKLGKKLAGD